MLHCLQLVFGPSCYLSVLSRSLFRLVASHPSLCLALSFSSISLDLRLSRYQISSVPFSLISPFVVFYNILPEDHFFSYYTLLSHPSLYLTLCCILLNIFPEYRSFSNPILSLSHPLLWFTLSYRNIALSPIPFSIISSSVVFYYTLPEYRFFSYYTLWSHPSLISPSVIFYYNISFRNIVLSPIPFSLYLTLCCGLLYLTGISLFLLSHSLLSHPLLCFTISSRNISLPYPILSYSEYRSLSYPILSLSHPL